VGRERGFSLVELFIGIAIVAILLMVGMPSMSDWLKNTQIRSQAEVLASGVQIARAEAVRRNTSARFSLVDTFTNACTLSTTGPNWIISLDDVSSSCDQAPSETVAPRIVKLGPGVEGAPGIAPLANVAVVCFNGLGRFIATTPAGCPNPALAGNFTIDVPDSTGANCMANGGKLRCLRIVVTPSGAVRMCDPSINSSADPRAC
jgi:type IV fimbrial biogenesis protein FimT